MKYKSLIVLAVSSALISAAGTTASFSASGTGSDSIVLAQSGHGGGGEGHGGGNQGGGNQGGGGKGGGGQGDAGQNRQGQNKATTTDDTDGDAKGKLGSGNRPGWASQELVDIGRLNVIKSPQAVLDRSLANVEEYEPSIYNKSVSQFVSSLTSLDQIIDSPVANLAALKAYWTDGTVALDGVTPASFADYSAILIGTAIDKTMTVTPDIVAALATIVFGDNVEADWPDGLDTVGELQNIADLANEVQAAVVVVHDS